MVKNERLQSVIEKDRLLISSDLSSLIEYDLTNLLQNYFNIEDKVTISVAPQKEYYQITILGKASGVKPFGIIK